MSAGACRAAADDGFGQGSRPVTNVSWEDAQAYVTWLNQKTGLTGRSDRYRLLSEAEWEYAARAGTTTPFHAGSTISTRQANYNGNFTYGSGVKGEYREKTVAAGSFPANAFGLHDRHGNVWEWVEDCSEWYSVQPSDGSAFTKNSCSSRVDRGGSWYSTPQVLRSAVRSGDSPGVRVNVLRFRLARTLP